MAIAFNPDIPDWETERVIHHTALGRLGLQPLPDFVCYVYMCPLCYPGNPVPNIPLQSSHSPEAMPTPTVFQQPTTCESEAFASPGAIPATLRGHSMQELGDNRAPLGSIKRNTDDNKITTKTSRVSPGLSTRALKSKDPKKQLVGLPARRKQGPRKKRVGAGARKESVLPNAFGLGAKQFTLPVR